MGFEVIIINLVLAIPVYFGCRRIFKAIKDDQRKKLFTALATVVVTPVLYIGIVLAWIAAISYYPERDFNQEQWNADADKRYELTDDLVESNLLIGRTKEEVVALLGREGVNAASSRYTYYIGYRPGLFNIDPDVLEVEFKDNRVVKCWVHGT